MADSAPTISDVVRAVERDPQMSTNRKKSVVRCLRRFAKLSGIREDDDISRINELIGTTVGWRPNKAGPPSKILPYIKYDVAFALRRFGFIESCSFKYHPVNQEWRAALSLISQDRLKRDLTRLARFCSKRDVGPRRVDDQLLREFGDALTNEGEVNDPRALLLQTINRWNRAREHCAGWPQSELKLPPSLKDVWTKPLEDFPATFQEDVNRWIDHLRIHGARRKDDLPNPLRPATLSKHRALIRTFASALVRSGHPIGAITSLRYLVQVSHFRDAIGFLFDRYGSRPTHTIYASALSVKAVARYWICIRQDHVKQLETYCRRLVCSAFGLSDRNRVLMLPFGDPNNARSLLALPQKLMCEARRQPGRKGAVLARDAVAMELLILAQLRRKVLSQIRVGKELRWAGAKGRLFLTVPTDENGPNRPLEFELPRETANMIRLYDREYRPVLSATPSDWLFPGKDGRQCNVRALAYHISQTIQRFTGLKVNTQLLRHIGARMYLDRNPGHYEIVRRIQGRRSVESAWRAYGESSARAAALHFDSSILGFSEDQPSNTNPNELVTGCDRSKEGPHEALPEGPGVARMRSRGLA